MKWPEISGGVPVVVSTDEIDAIVFRLKAFLAQLDDAQQGIDQAAAMARIAHFDEVADRLAMTAYPYRGARALAEAIRANLVEASVHYEDVERRVEAGIRAQVLEGFAEGAGPLAALAVSAERAQLEALRRFAVENPRGVELILGISRVDDAVEALLAKVDGLSRLTAADLDLRVVADGAVSPPTTLGELVSRVPDSNPGDPQLRIEAYPQPDGTTRWVVYVGGTISWKLMDLEEPWSFGSDALLAQGKSAPALTAVAEAMKRAGIRPDDEVLMVGFSLGGMITTALAALGVARVRTNLTLGSPVQNQRIPASVNQVNVYHADDPISAIGGRNDDPRVQEVKVWTKRGEGGHDRNQYIDTMSDPNVVGDPRLRDQEAGMRAFVGSGLGTFRKVRAGYANSARAKVSGEPSTAGRRARRAS